MLVVGGGFGEAKAGASKNDDCAFPCPCDDEHEAAALHGPSHAGNAVYAQVVYAQVECEDDGHAPCDTDCQDCGCCSLGSVATLDETPLWSVPVRAQSTPARTLELRALARAQGVYRPPRALT